MENKELRRDVLHRKIAKAIKENDEPLLMVIDPQVVEHVKEYEKYLVDDNTIE
jgi:hypothetical protein